MIELLPAPSEFVETTSQQVPYPLEVEQAVDLIWQAEKSKRPHLFDGQLFVVEQLTPQRASGRFVAYRYFMAQLKRPELFEALRLEALAVSGALFSPDGIVVGRRDHTVTQEGGVWELVPAGGIDRHCVVPGGRLEVTRQLMVELEEEVGLTANDITLTEIDCLMHDRERHVFDIGIKLVTSRLREDILARHRALKEAEHSELRVISRESLPQFVAQSGEEFLPVSAVLLRGLGVLPLA